MVTIQANDMKYQQLWFSSRSKNWFLIMSDYISWMDMEKNTSAKIALELFEYDIERIHGNLDADV